MLDLVLLTLAVFWIWETVRYPAEQYLPTAFAVTRPVHPLLVAALPLWVLWPDWVSALAVAALVGIVHLFVGRMIGADQTPVQVVRHTPHGLRGQRGLPPLP